MKRSYLYTAMAILGLSGLYSCKKYAREDRYVTSITFNNATADKISLLTYFKEGVPVYFSRLNGIEPGYHLRYVTDDAKQYINYFDAADTVSSKRTLLAKELDLEAGAVYTHFLYGRRNNLKEMLLKEQIPGYNLTDSVTHFRILNLFENRNIDVHQTAPVFKELVSDLGYEKHSAFIQLDCKSADVLFSFEFRDHTTNEVLATTDLYNDSGAFSSKVELLRRANTLTLFGFYAGPANNNAQIGRVPHYY
jgi:hypothetical protein